MQGRQHDVDLKLLSIGLPLESYNWKIVSRGVENRMLVFSKLMDETKKIMVYGLNVEFWGVGDASERGYGACVYLRVPNVSYLRHKLSNFQSKGSTIEEANLT